MLILAVFVHRSADSGLSQEKAFWSGIWAIAFGLIGARVYWFLQHIDLSVQSPSVIVSFSGSTASWGGYVGGTLGFLLSLRLYGVQALGPLDTVSSTLGLGIFICRLGCFLDGCCFGKISSIPWAIRYPAGSLPFDVHLQGNLITIDAQSSLPTHPVQLYLAVNGLCLFALGSWCWHRFGKHKGVTFIVFWLSFCITRFILEFFRGDEIRGFLGPISTPQLICVLVTTAVISLIPCVLKKNRVSQQGGMNV